MANGIVRAGQPVSVPAPTANDHAARKQDVDAKLNLSGGTITGPVTFQTPTHLDFSPSTTQHVGVDIASYLFSPLGAILWHDLLRFNDEFGTPTVEKLLDGVWTADTSDGLVKTLFNGKQNQRVDISDPDAATPWTATRWTWNGAQFADAKWLCIGFAYVASSTWTVLVENSPDGTTWSQAHLSSGTTAGAPAFFYAPPTSGSDPYLRITITTTSSPAEVDLASIQFLGSRWGDQGGGIEKTLPYTWDENKNMGIGSAPNSSAKLVVGGHIGLTGGNTLWGVPTPTANDHAANKQYVDNAKIVINAKDYGALGDAAADDTSEIQAAIDAAAAAGGGVVYLPNGTYMVSVPILLKDKVRLIGTSRSGTVIRATAGFTGTHVIRIGAGSGIVFGCAIEWLTVDANDVVDLCVYSTEGQELSGVFGCLLTKFRNSGIRINAGARYMSFERLELYGSTLGWTYGADFDGCTGPMSLRTATINSNNTSVNGTAGIRAASTKLHVTGVHGERVGDTILFDTGSQGIAENIDATTGVTGRAVRIVSTNTGGINLYNVSSVNDQVNSTDTADFQTVYLLDAYGSGSSKSRVSLRAGITNRWNNGQQLASFLTLIRNHVTATTASATIDLTAGGHHQLTLQANVTSLTISNGADGMLFMLRVVQDATGSRTVTWPASVKWAGGVAPTLTTTANGVDVFFFLCMGGNFFEVSRALQSTLVPTHVHSGADITSGTVAAARLPLVPNPPSSITYAASLTPVASDGNYRTVTMTGDMTLNPPTSPADGQMWRIRCIASGAQRTVTLAAGLKRPSHIASTLVVASGGRGDIGLLYETAFSAWTVLAAQAVV